jgi:mannose-6-phosphate isomerase-like protein (cupin superfamily)
VDFPLNNAVGTESTAVMYFEIEPGHYLPTHTDSAEEILYIVAGTARAHVGDEEAIVRAGDLAVIPAMVPTVPRTSARTRSRSSASSAPPTSARRSRRRWSPWARPRPRWASPA